MSSIVVRGHNYTLLEKNHIIAFKYLNSPQAYIGIAYVLFNIMMLLEEIGRPIKMAEKDRRLHGVVDLYFCLGSLSSAVKQIRSNNRINKISRFSLSHQSGCPRSFSAKQHLNMFEVQHCTWCW